MRNTKNLMVARVYQEMKDSELSRTEPFQELHWLTKY